MVYFNATFIIYYHFILVLGEVILLRQNEERYYDGTQYDKYDDATFLQKIEGVNKYGISMWYKQSDNTDNQMLFHMTFINNARPWDRNAQTTSYQHLSIILQCVITSANLKCSTSTFEGIKDVINQNGFNQLNQWYFLYFGVDQDNRKYTVSVYNSGSAAESSADFFLDQQSQVSTNGIGNEQLDQRIKLYIGGSLDRNVSPDIGFKGFIFKPIFYTNFFTDNVDSSHFQMMLGDRSSQYYINVNQGETLRSYDSQNKQIYATYGTNPNLKGEADDPTFHTTDGLKFTTINTKMNLNLDIEFDQTHFISFWLKVNGNTAGQEVSIFEIHNTLGAPKRIFGLFYKVNDNKLYGITEATTFDASSITANAWTHIYLSFAIYSLNEKVVFTLITDGTTTITDSLGRPPQNIPDIRKSTFQYKFGKGISDSFRGDIKDIKGGLGSFADITNGITNCKLAIGISAPECILCNTNNLHNGACVATCPAGTYVDALAKFCRPCHDSCKQCNGPLENNCSGADGVVACSTENPFLFQSRCFSECPVGTVANKVNQTCNCHSSCTTCTYDVNNGVECTACSTPATLPFIQGYECVASLQCASTTFGNASTTKCQTTCIAPNTFKNFAARLCVPVCPLGTIKHNNDCLLSCPPAFYSNAVTPGGAGEYDKQCAPCVPNCENCETNTKCTKCQANFLIHESTGECQNTCNSGFTQDGVICRVCSQDCTDCPAGYYLHLKKCVNPCPIGYRYPGTGNACDKDPNPIVKIESPSTATINVGRRQDLIFQGYHFFIGNITSEQWSLTGASASEKDTFFSKTFANYTTLYIPYGNLKSNFQYNLEYKVVTETGTSGTASIIVNTSNKIQGGTLSITPDSGVSGVTEITIKYSGWTSGGPVLKYDIIFGKQKKYTQRGKQISQLEDSNPILLQSTEQTKEIKFTFPPYKQSQKVVVQFRAYTAEEEIIQTKEIQLSQFQTDNALAFDYKSDVWWIQLQTGLSLAEYLKRSYFIPYLYQSSIDNIVNRESQVNILKEKQNIKLVDTECQDDVQCRGAGTCGYNFYDKSTYECKCFWNMKGQHCDWEDRSLQTMYNVTYQLLFNLQSFTYQPQDLFSLQQILSNIVKIEDGLHKKSFRLLRTMITKAIDDFDSDDLNVYTNLVETISNCLYQSTSRPSLRPDEKRKYSIVFKGLLDKLLEKIQKKFIRFNEELIIENRFLTVLLIRQTGTELLSSQTNIQNNAVIPLKRAVIHFPGNMFTFNETYTIQVIQFDFDPVYPPGNLLTSSLQIDVTKLNGEKIQQNLGGEISLFMRKVSSFPPLRTDIDTFYQCAYLKQIDEDTFEWISDASVKYTFENEHFIKCITNHLSHFTIRRGLLEFLKELPSDSQMKLFSNSMLNINLKSINNTEYDIDQNIALSQRIFKVNEFPNSKFKFRWDSPFTVIFFVSLFVYFLFSLINLYRSKRKTIYIYSEKHQDILMLSYHPILSLIFLGQTFFSHTYQMRMTKFFSICLSTIAYIAVIYRRIDNIDLQIKTGEVVVVSMFFGTFLSMGTNYLWELFYYLVYMHVSKKVRNQWIYSLIFIINMGLMGAYGIYENGNTDQKEYGSYILAIILALAIDILLVDTIVVFYAYYQLESPFLNFLAFRGFFIRSNQKYLIPDGLLNEKDQDDDDDDIEDKKQLIEGVEQKSDGQKDEIEMLKGLQKNHQQQQQQQDLEKPMQKPKEDTQLDTLNENQRKQSKKIVTQSQQDDDLEIIKM